MRSDGFAVWRTSRIVNVASVYGLVAESPYRSLPEATVVGARAQDACSIVVAGAAAGVASALLTDWSNPIYAQVMLLVAFIAVLRLRGSGPLPFKRLMARS